MLRKFSAGFGVLLLAVVVAAAGCSKGGDEGKAQEGASTAASQGSAGTVHPPMNHSVLINELKAQLDKDPKNTELMLRLGDAYFDLKSFDQAVVYYKQVAETDMASADVFNDIGLSLHYLGNSAEGLQYIERGIKSNPYHQRIWLTKGFVLAYGAGDLEGAKEAWEKAKALDPESRVGKAAADYLMQISKQ